MRKIPTLFKRDSDFKCIDEPHPDCDWVFKGEGIATEKLHGTNVRLTIRNNLGAPDVFGTVVRVEKRHNPTREQKEVGILDPWYMDALPDNPNDKWMIEAAKRIVIGRPIPDGEHCCEAMGPKIQGNPLGLEEHMCFPFDLTAPRYAEAPISFVELSLFLKELDSVWAPGHLAEGVVFHHHDGRRAKLKRSDFRYDS